MNIDCLKIIPLFLLAFPLIIGCGQQAPYKVVQIEGKLVHENQPLDEFEITFTPTEKGRPSSAVTKSGGLFKAKYSPSISGVQVGKSIVTIKYLGNLGVTGNQSVPDEYVELLKKYSFGTAGYPVEITKTDRNFIIDLP